MGKEAVQIILLTGPKHSGKSRTGRALAERWEGRFIDLDELIEERTGKTPRTLFKEGPEIFREAEAEALAACCTCEFFALDAAKNPRLSGCANLRFDGSLQGKKSPNRRFLKGLYAKRNKLLAEIVRGRERLVVAAGGGLIDNGGAITLLENSRNIFIVSLEVSAETAWNRILNTAAGGELPPFLQSADPRETHRQLHERRARAYRDIARIVIDAEDKSPDAIAEEIEKIMEHL
jgi:shikimate kinase